ncbi:MAG: hypothetical protein BroJett021_27970 [Chloroflexota bacterium]|nr:MAG: hypothetical protein BroJett021_27970 [Chloroflexota bacterium]
MLTAAELASMQSTQAAAMMDACKLLAPTRTTGDFGQHGVTYSEGDEIACGFESPTAQRGGTLAGVEVILNARIRLDLTNGANVTPDHRIKLTKRLGTTLSTAEVYRVAGWPRRGPTAFVVELERVE